MVLIGVDIDQIDKMAPRGVKSALGAIELNWHFGAETDLLNLQCRHKTVFTIQVYQDNGQFLYNKTLTLFCDNL